MYIHVKKENWALQIEDANLVLAPGCTVILRNEGVINMAEGKSFEAPVGAIVN